MVLKLALAGQPNSGKTTMFNELTGANQHVGNWPGVTVEKKEGWLKGHKDVIIQDLPGIYSLSPYSPEEMVSREYLVNDCPDAIINIVDASNLERNLFLTLQLTELGLPVVVALNMMDVVKKNKESINTEVLSRHLNSPVIETSALKGENAMQVVEEAIRQAGIKKTTAPPCVFSGSTEHSLAHIEDLLRHVLEDDQHQEHMLAAAEHADNPASLVYHRHDGSDYHVHHPRNSAGHHVHHHRDGSLAAEIPAERLRWYAIKLFERDPHVSKHLALDAATAAQVEGFTSECERHQNEDAEAIIIRERYDYISQLLKEVAVKRRVGQTVSDKIDSVITNRWLGLPIFAAVMFLVYYISISTLGGMMTDWANEVLFAEIVPQAVTGWLEALQVAPWLVMLVVDGIIGGVGAVLGFLPQLVVLFLCLSLLEECGYMSRIAFLLDRLFRRFGLSGKSFIPMLVATGCAVPGIMASRTIENDKDRRMTVMTTSFMPCGAKIPFIGLIAGALFDGSAWVATAAYFIGIAAILCSGIILKKTKAFASKAAPFVMELPSYRLPRLKNVLHSVWDRSKSFVIKAGTIILLAAVVIWVTSNFSWQFRMVEMEESILASIGNLLAPLFSPLGFGDWRAAVATLTGLTAKEAIVSTMGVLYAGVEIASETGTEIWANVAASFTGLSAFSFMVFNLLTIPCFAAVGAIRREMAASKWTWAALGYQLLLSYAATFMIYQLGLLVSGNGFGFASAVAILALLCFCYLLFRKNKYANLLA